MHLSLNLTVLTNWLIGTLDTLFQMPEIVINGFRKAGIVPVSRDLTVPAVPGYIAIAEKDNKEKASQEMHSPSRS